MGLPLHGHRVLIIEDEPLIAFDLSEALIQVGADVVGIAATVEDALMAVAAPSLTAAIVDLRLSGRSVRDAVQRLSDRDLPFIFYSGLDVTPTARSWPKVPLLLKPLPPEEVAAALAQVVSAHRSAGSIG
jgi:DNA-binding response OmpR family regulator